MNVWERDDGTVHRMECRGDCGRGDCADERSPGDISGHPADVAGRPPLRIQSTAEMVEWLRAEIGTGRMAGMFARGDDVVFCPRIGDDGYVKLTTVERDEDGPAQVRPMSISRIASYVQLAYWCYKIVKDEDGNTFPVAAMFPSGAARPAFDHPDKMGHLRRLRGVTHTPIPQADGTILDSPGYDPATRLLYLPAPGLAVEPVPVEPTDTQVAEALKGLRWLVKDFNFLTAHDEANFHGALLTPLLREITPPPYKLVAIGAPQPGSGKSLLAAIPRTLHGGVFRSEVPSDEAEMRKSITSILDITTGPVVQLDNVSGVLRSSVLSGLLTSDVWEDRRLGSTSHLRCRNDRLWMITGNNLTVGGDLVRRTVWCTIDPACPNPHLRTGFDIDPRAYAASHRGELLHALLVLVRHWVCRGRPTQRRGSDSYATWIEAVAGILTTAGHPGVFDHTDSARQSVGHDDDEWQEFLVAIHGEFGETSWTVKELLGKFQPRIEANEHGCRTEVPGPLQLDALPTELAEKAARANRGPELIGRSLGRWLANREGRWAGDLTVRRAGTERGAMIRWSIQPYQRPEDGSH
ncbi:MAG: hypothetical protein JO364_06550 [Pseudonocardiales bacterium]|nr:hypothetical protein [Pseudonocardiales bacterium]MBV9029960.1 hypothetical protein [Pseudonocardiales bacterium]